MAKGYDILSDTERIIRRHKIPKPKSLDRQSWNELSYETKYLWNRIELLGGLVYEAYLEALRHEDWKRALELVLASIGKPMFLSVSRILYCEDVCRRNEAEFIARAKEWIAEAESLLA